MVYCAVLICIFLDSDFTTDPNDSARGFVYAGQVNPSELSNFCREGLPWPGKIPTVNTQQRIDLLKTQPISGDFYVGLYLENDDQTCLSFEECSSSKFYAIIQNIFFY